MKFMQSTSLRYDERLRGDVFFNSCSKLILYPFQGGCGSHSLMKPDNCDSFQIFYRVLTAMKIQSIKAACFLRLHVSGKQRPALDQ